jgi:ribonuclease PH
VRIDGRAADSLRPVHIELDVNKYAEGSCLINMGDTRVLCTATVENKVPPFLHGQGQGWVHAEYGMLPRSTGSRMQREAVRGQLGGRTMEIQRLIGRSLRSAVDLAALGERTVIIDCDVLQADGGTRTASITGGFVAMYRALARITPDLKTERVPVKELTAAVSVGRVGGELLLDLAYAEDVEAEVDMNVIMTESGRFIEIQGTGEEATFSRADLNILLDLASKGINGLIAAQKQALGI